MSDRKVTFGEHPLFYPSRDWKIMFLIFLVLCAGVIAMGLYMLSQVEQDAFFEGGEPDPSALELTFDANQLQNTVGHYEQKRERYRELQASPPQVFDPSR